MDHLTTIKGIGKATAKKLADAGVDSFAKLAAMQPTDQPLAGMTTEAEAARWIDAAAAAANSSAGGGDMMTPNPTPAASAETAGTSLGTDAATAAPDAPSASPPAGTLSTNNRESEAQGGSGNPAAPASRPLDAQTPSREAVAAGAIIYDGRTYADGDPMVLTQAAFEQLAAAGVLRV